MANPQVCTAFCSMLHPRLPDHFPEFVEVKVLFKGSSGSSRKQPRDARLKQTAGRHLSELCDLSRSCLETPIPLYSGILS